MFAKKLVDESYMGDWSDVLESMGKPIDTSDPLVRVCLHCGEANLVCRRKRSQESKEQMTVALKNAESFVAEEKYVFFSLGERKVHLFTQTFMFKILQVRRCFPRVVLRFNLLRRLGCAPRQ